MPSVGTSRNNLVKRWPWFGTSTKLMVILSLLILTTAMVLTPCMFYSSTYSISRETGTDGLIVGDMAFGVGATR